MPGICVSRKRRAGVGSKQGERALSRSLILAVSAAGWLLLLLILNRCGGAQEPATGPHYFLSTRASEVTLQQDGQASLSLTLERVGGFSEPIQLSATGLPEGVEASFDPNPVPADQNSATLTLRGQLEASLGDYTLVVHAQGGTIRREVQIKLTIRSAAPDFNLQVRESSLSVVQGGTVTQQIEISRIGGFQEAINLSLEGVPAGITATLSPNPIPGSQTQSRLTLQVSSTVPVGTYTLTVVATSGTIRRTAQFVLIVVTAPDFSLSLSTSQVSLVPGGQAELKATLNRVGGFSQPVTLSVSGAPAGVTVTITPTTLTQGQNEATLTLQASGNATPGSYTLTLRGSGGGLTRTASFILRITEAPDFSLTLDPSTLSVVQGGQGSVRVQAARVGGLSEGIDLSLQGAPTGVSGTFTPTRLTPGQDSATLLIQVSSTTPAGTYLLSVVGTTPRLRRSATLTLEIRVPSDFRLTLNPSTLSIAQGGSATARVSATGVGGFNDPINLTASGMPSGVTVNFNPASIRPGQESVMTVQVASQTAYGSYLLTVRGTAGSLTHTVELRLEVQVSFRYAIQPIFTRSCTTIGCHDSLGRAADLDLSEGNAYRNLVNVRSSQNSSWIRVVPGDPVQSLLYLKVLEDNPPVGRRMPWGGPPLSQEEITRIRLWIEQGAQNN